MKKRIEFPLFELLSLIILLFVLAIFALPKFMDVGSEARIKTLNATALNLDSVNRLLYSRAVINNVQHNALQATDVLGEKDAGAHLVYGELRASIMDIRLFITSPLLGYASGVQKGKVRLYLENYRNERCYIEYYQASAENSSSVQIKIKRAYTRIQSSGC